MCRTAETTSKQLGPFLRCLERRFHRPHVSQRRAAVQMSHRLIIVKPGEQSVERPTESRANDAVRCRTCQRRLLYTSADGRDQLLGSCSSLWHLPAVVSSCRPDTNRPDFGSKTTCFLLSSRSILSSLAILTSGQDCRWLANAKASKLKNGPFRICAGVAEW